DGRIAGVASELGYWTVMWTIDTIDWQRPSPSRIVERVVPRLAPGAIILMHPTQPTLEAPPPILEAIRAKGMDVVPVGRLIEAGLGGQELPEASAPAWSRPGKGEARARTGPVRHWASAATGRLGATRQPAGSSCPGPPGPAARGRRPPGRTGSRSGAWPRGSPGSRTRPGCPSHSGSRGSWPSRPSGG